MSSHKVRERGLRNVERSLDALLARAMKQPGVATYSDVFGQLSKVADVVRPYLEAMTVVSSCAATNTSKAGDLL